MDDFSELMPREREVLVGNQKMIVKDYSPAQQAAVLKILGGNLEIKKVFSPVVEAMRAAKGETSDDKSIDVGEVLDQIKGLVMKLFAEDLPKVCAITLDVDENRARAKVKGEVKLHKLGYKYCQEMVDWIEDNLTSRQMWPVIEAAVEVNDFAGTAKNFMTLIAGKAQAVGEEKAESGSAS